MAQIAFTGNIVAQPEIKFAASGKAVAKARLAENHRGKNPQTGEWEDQGTSWRNLVAFGAQAEKLAEVPKGSPLVVIGRESARAYTKDGEERQWIEVAIDSFGIAPRGQSRPAQPSQQGEGWNAQQAPQYGHGAGGGDGWPPAAQPGSGQQQGGFGPDYRDPAPF